ncbi:MAG: serine/threonine-protein kinase [Pirellulales bacterium]
MPDRIDRGVDEIEPPRPAAIKFLHASGSRPLEGYTIKRGVGRGGFGEVYFATSDAGKEVALKLIRRNLEVELRGVTHCLNLKHPNLVALYDIRTDDMGDQWVVMEYVCGESLEQVIERHPDGVPIDEAMWWMRGICAGVGYLHDHGIVHRDLKPGNIFLDEGTVKIGDYGLSKFISCSRRSGQTESVGTVHYMAPEIANGRYGREIDTYALGVMLYEMLTGSVPFEGESVGEVLMKHLTAEPSLEAVPQPFRDIVARALAKDPEVRFANVGELLELLPGGTTQAAYQGPASASVQTTGNGRNGSSLFSPAAVIRPKAWEAQFGRNRNSEDSGEIPEPIAKMLRQSIQNLTDGWNAWTSNPLAKSLVAIAAVVAAVFSVWGWIPVLMTGFFLYCLYYPAWVWFIRPNMKSPANPLFSERPTVAVATPVAVAAAPPPTQREQAAERKRRRYGWRDQALREVAIKPIRDKATELLGSMLIAAGMCVALSGLGAMLVAGDRVTFNTSFPIFLWLATVSTVGCWTVLATNKVTEGRVEDQVPTRGLQLGSGALVGLIAWAVGSMLWIGLPVSRDLAIQPGDSLAGEFLGWRDSYFASHYSSGSVAPPLAITVGYFALLFVALRWWRLAEYTRRVRVSIWSIAWMGFAAWLLQFGWWFPQPSGLAVAAIIAASTQLASPWMPPSRRRELAARAV